MANRLLLTQHLKGEQHFLRLKLDLRGTHSVMFSFSFIDGLEKVELYVSTDILFLTEALFGGSLISGFFVVN